MIQRNLIKRSSVIASSLLVISVIGLLLLVVSVGVILLGHLLSYISADLLQGEPMSILHYVLVVLAVTCTAGLGIPILILARDIQKSTESFSLLQFEDDEDEMDDEYDDDDDEGDFMIDDEEFDEFLKKLDTTRNIGPFIPSPEAMDDLCPCGSGLKYKDCCGKFRF